MKPRSATSVGPTGKSHKTDRAKPTKAVTPPIKEPMTASCRMLDATTWAVKGGRSKNPTVTRGPTLRTDIDIVKPMRRKREVSQTATFFFSVTAMSRSKETRRNSLLKSHRKKQTST